MIEVTLIVCLTLLAIASGVAALIYQIKVKPLDTKPSIEVEELHERVKSLEVAVVKLKKKFNRRALSSVMEE
jgi:hypothetical protein